ncbi:MAG: FMN-binding negative transcriptional regulator [Alphaproteobacteria bacterium]|nr:FMN-binding negative transcriptional regulator [Alphaproteobacteria bacterium]
MYVPSRFAIDDPPFLSDLINGYSFGVLVTAIDGVPEATHLPFLFEANAGRQGVLVAHMARANPHWRAFREDRESLVVFQGPHGYVSPQWYAAGGYVPTWNYAAVHAYGVARVIEEPARVRAVLDRLVIAHEAGFDRPWRLADRDPEFLDRMQRAIVAFELPIARWQGKAKLSQDKTAADRRGVIEALGASGRDLDAALAALMSGHEPAAD